MTEDVGRRPATVAEARETARRRPRPPARGRRGGDGMSLPLEGVRVLDLSRLLPGGFCSLLLADFGADVLKVEDTGMGDYVRWAPPYYEGADDSAQVRAVPGAEPQQALDPHRTSRAEAGARCCCGSRASTTCCSSPSGPGVLDRLGVGYERLREENPGLVYCAITGYGQDGPLPRPLRPRHELPRPGRPARADRRRAAGRRSRPAGQIADIGGGALMAAFGILAALRERDRSGEGQLVDVSMADGALSWLAMVAGALLRRRRRPAARRARAGRARSSATGPTRAPTAGSRSARSSRSSGRRGAAASAART